MLAKQIKMALVKEPERIQFFLDAHPELTKKLAQELVPRTIGIEIEVQNPSDSIPLLRRPDCSHDQSELRYFLKRGIDFFLELHEVTKLLQQHSTINPSSGIHYQTFSYLKNIKEVFYNISSSEQDTELDKMMTKEFVKLIKHWNYTGTYNIPKVHLSSGGNHIMRINGEFNTWEVRVGEMTFDYALIVKRSVNTIKVTRHIEKNMSRLIKSLFDESKMTRFKEKISYLNPPSTKYIGVDRDVFRQRLNKLLFG